jgi:hypothetical protein
MNTEAIPVTNVSTEELKPKSPEKYGDFDFTSANLGKLISDWSTVQDKVERNRRTIDYTVDNKELRASQDLQEDELLTPVRMIKKNIKRLIPSYLEALVGTQDVVSLKNSIDPTISPDALNSEITKLLRTNSWLENHILNIQGFLSHGISYIVTEFNVDTPSSIDNIRYKVEDVLIPSDLEDLQSAELIALRLTVTPTKLRELVTKFEFNKSVADKAIKDKIVDQESLRPKENAFHIYHCYYKQDGVVYHAWISNTRSSTWLKSPKPLYLGRSDKEEEPELDVVGQPILDQEGNPVIKVNLIPAQEFEYPIDVYYRSFPESGRVLEASGVAEDSGPIQEAATILLSTHINATVRSGNLYASVNALSEEDSGDAPAQLDVKLKAGEILNRPVTSHSVQRPDNTSIEALSYLSQENADEQSQFSFLLGVGRGDRKTATETNAAQQQTSQASSQDLLVYHLAYHSTVTRAVRIMLNRWRNGKLDIKAPEELKDSRWHIEPVAQKDALMKQQRIQQRRMDWPVVSVTPMADLFFVDWIREAYPAHSDKYVQALNDGGGVNGLTKENQQLKGQLGSAANILESLLSEGMLEELDPKERETLNQQIQQMKGVAADEG